MSTFVVTTSLDLLHDRESAATIFYLVEAVNEREAEEKLKDFSDYMHADEEVIDCQLLHWMNNSDIAWVGQISKYNPFDRKE